MIKYKLICKNCELSFDSWFASSQEYEKLRKKNFLNCHNCNSKKVEKTLMAPKLINQYVLKKKDQSSLKLEKFNNKLKEYQKYIKDNFKYVGKNFAYEARSIHYNEKKRDKGIYGTATNDELKELKEEGIEAEVMPWSDNINN